MLFLLHAVSSFFVIFVPNLCALPPPIPKVAIFLCPFSYEKIYFWIHCLSLTVLGDESCCKLHLAKTQQSIITIIIKTTFMFLSMAALRDQEIPKVGWPFDLQGTIPMFGMRGCSRFQVRLSFPKHGCTCPPGGFGSLPRWIVWGHQLVCHSCEACHHHARDMMLSR
jgi:hypothetical protein